jgi:threonine dehydratase
VESEKCPSFSKALENGGPIYTPNEATLADGLAVPKVGVNAYATVVPLLDKMIVVKEEWIALAILRLVELEKVVVEGAGAAGLAAILAGQLDEFKGKKYRAFLESFSKVPLLNKFSKISGLYYCCVVEILIQLFLDVAWKEAWLLKVVY